MWSFTCMLPQSYHNTKKWITFYQKINAFSMIIIYRFYRFSISFILNQTEPKLLNISLIIFSYGLWRQVTTSFIWHLNFLNLSITCEYRHVGLPRAVSHEKFLAMSSSFSSYFKICKWILTYWFKVRENISNNWHIYI